MRHGCVVLAALACIPFQMPAQQQRPQFGCKEALHRQFDFWIGEWAVTNPAGQSIGKNVIRSIQDGCAIEENWSGGPNGSGGGTGTSLNFVERGSWHQIWVANTATVLRLTGGLENGAMVMTGETTNPQGVKVVNRVVWTPIEGGKVTQNWDTSTDGGKTWTPAFRGIYTKVVKDR